MPFIKAFESGLWIYWITEKNIICIPRPIITLKGDLLHNEKTAAVYWPKGEKYYFLNGVQMNQDIVETSAENLNPELLVKETNAEVRREIIRKIGMGRILQKLNAEKLDSWREYELYTIKNIDIEPVNILKMVCPSKDILYTLRVPPEIKGAREAIIWINNGVFPEQFLVEA